MNYTLELVIVPVSDVDRAKAFYTDQAGFDVHVDHRAGDDFRVVQLNPPGSACSIAIGTIKPGPGPCRAWPRFRHQPD
jgi:catechol 2,3-dioxygenase-like lactoylglutathione lyase family enzyme